MSAGAFVLSKYEADYSATTQVHPIRVQPETISASTTTVSNDAPIDDVTNPISAIVSKSNRGLGLKPRTIRIQFPMTGQPANYQPGGVTTIPALTKAFYASAVKGATITYMTVQCTVVGRSPERVG